MQTLFLAAGVTLTILAITAIKSSKIRVAVYSLPIPISIILIATDATINATHPFSLLLVILFMTITWLLHTKLKQNILISVAIGVVMYVIVGLVNQLIVKIPFEYMYAFMVCLWVVWILFQPLHTVKPVHVQEKTLMPRDYTIRGLTVFALTFIISGLRSLILGASVTFPFNGIFTAYIMRHSLLYLISEFSRNSIGVVNFFGTLYILQDRVGKPEAFIAAWIVAIVSIYGVVKFIPRKSKFLT